MMVFNPAEDRSTKEGTPCNSLDGAIYFGTYASNGDDLIVLNPDGTERWRLHLANGYILFAPTIGSDGTVYVGS
jgi:outer membrane protein assembly factor BamB